MMKPGSLKRIFQEIEDVNADFFNLRTVLSQDTDSDDLKFYFVMLPNDGAMAHLPLVGALYIHDNYPAYPPVVHLYTKTGRFNVDVYRHETGNITRSTLCFDVLSSEFQGGTWKPGYSISLLFASLMSAIVSFSVPQQAGGDRDEPVSMGKLHEVKAAARATFQEYRDRLPPIPAIPAIAATPIPAEQMPFPSKITTSEGEKFTSGPIYLQTKDSTAHTFAMDLTGLHPGIVFSIVLSSSTSDIAGRKPDVIIVRNGVTATAARKRAGESTKWFYHGKPMDEKIARLHVTIGRGQMTLAYEAEGRMVVHGDSPVSRLGVFQIGDVSGLPFYVHVVMKRKSGGEAWVTFLDTEGKGYVHDPTREVRDGLEGEMDQLGIKDEDREELAEQGWDVV